MKNNKLLYVMIVVLIIAWIIFPIILSDDNVKVPDNERFLVIDHGSIMDVNSKFEYCIVLDNNTGVKYYMPKYGDNKGVLIPLYNSDGNILTLENENILN